MNGSTSKFFTWPSPLASQPGLSAVRADRYWHPPRQVVGLFRLLLPQLPLAGGEVVTVQLDVRMIQRQP